MLDSIRYKIGTRLLRKADEEINKGGVEHINQGFRYIKAAITIIPMSDDLRHFGDHMREMAEQHTNEK